MRPDDDTSDFSDDELFRLEEDEAEDFDFVDDDAAEVDDLLNDVLREEEAILGSRDEERVLRYAVSEDKESKASQFRMRSGDIDQSQMDVPMPEAANVEDEWLDVQRRNPVNRLFVFGGAVLLAILAVGVIWAAMALRHGDAVGDLSGRQIEERAELEARSDQDAREMMHVIEQVCRDYLVATTVNEKSKYVSHREKVLPMMREYYSRNVLTASELISLDVRLSSDSNLRIFWIVDCVLKGMEGPQRLVVAQKDQNKFEVVWELDVVYQPMTAKGFIKNRPEGAIPFRLMVKAKAKSGFYGYSFSDYKKYRCFQLFFPNEERFLWGYTEIGSEADKLVYDAYKAVSVKGSNEGGYPMMLGLRFLPEDGSQKSVLIDHFIDKDWMID